MSIAVDSGLKAFQATMLCRVLTRVYPVVTLTHKLQQLITKLPAASNSNISENIYPIYPSKL